MSQNIKLTPFGMVLYDNNNYSKLDEIKIALAGPIINIALAILGVAIWWYVPTSYYYLYDWVFANMILGCYNLIPIYPLDGGRVLLLLFPKRSRYKIRKIMKIFALIFAILFVGLFVYSLFHKYNLSYLFMSFFLISTILDKEKIEIKLPMFNNNEIKEVKTFVVNKDTDMTKIIRLIKEDFFYQFVIVDDNDKIIKKITQNEVLDYYTKK